jgi:putative copper export protein
MDAILTWLVRWLHVTGAAFWVGGYLVLAFALIPRLGHGPGDGLARAALLATRVLSYSGALTIVAGLVLVARTRGYGQLVAGEWGGIVVGSAVLAVAMMGIGDGPLRAALRRLAEDAPADGGGSSATAASAVAAARRWALLSLAAGILALGFMTRAIYAR